ncbi:MAG TPA: T9SS type A sorting domain-containing protein [Saprospiraceae bacterium]|nr:T9SS type A sorting domain-containing protein [Saprospiraceae bacterium]
MTLLAVSGNGIRKLCPSGLFATHWFALLIFLMSIASTTHSYSQCSMTCRGKVNISLGDSCRAVLTPDMFLTTRESCPDGRFRVDVLDYNMKPLNTGGIVDVRHLKMNLFAMVYDSVSKNSCWSKLLVEDKFGPIIECKNDTLYCNDTTIYHPPVFYDWCDPFPTIELVDRNPQILDCDPLFVKRVIRSWRAKDAWGNLSKLCVDTIWLKRIPIDSVWFPKDFVKANSCHLECNGDWPKDAEGHPHPDTTGAPHIHGITLWPDYNVFCNLGTSYEDIVLVKNECKTKVLRMWRVVEWWCGQARIRTHAQTIEILDTKPPVLHCPYAMTVNTNGYSGCKSRFTLPPADVHDECQDSIRVDVYYQDGILINQNGGVVELSAGTHDVVYRAYDRCYNEDSCVVRVTVIDRTPPVAVCHRQTVVTLTRDDEVHVYAKVFDDGSHDECHLDSFLVKRMDDGAPCGFRDTAFAPFVRFCCEDAGKLVMVIFRAIDEFGNYNDCMVEVEVQDKTPPIIYCPHDFTIACDRHIDTADFKNHFGTASYYDNCVVHMHEYIVPHLNQCNIGYYDRNFVVRDNMGRYDTCTQRIFVRDTDLFDERYIVWPKDTTINSCGANTNPGNFVDTFGYPIFLDRTCALIGTSYTDHIFNYIQDANVCFKVLRKWKVIDWCQQYYDNSGNLVIPSWTHEQVIKVQNSLPPKILDDCEPVRICMQGLNCYKAQVVLSHTAKDDCTPDSLMRSGFKLDMFNNGLFDSTYFTPGNTISVDIELPAGEHEFFWIFEDQCGNQEVCSQIVRVVNCKPPTAYCLTGVAINLMGIDSDKNGKIDGGMATVWASDLDKGSFHQCGNPVTLSFSRDSSDKFREYTCDSLGMRRVEIWVTDEITGLQDFCVTTVIVQDNNKVCSSTNLTANIAGAIITPYNKGISGVQVLVNNAPSEFSDTYMFKNLPIGSDYTVKAIKDKDYLDGVTTLDIVKIQKHILGIEELDNPWKYIAADANNDQRVTTADIAAIRRLILGVDVKYKNNLSWRFVEANQQFVDPKNPWAESLTEEYSILGLSGPMMYMDFKGVKVGDVSQNLWGQFNESTSRTGDKVTLYTYAETNSNRIPIVIKNTANLKALQFTLDYNPQEIEILGVQSAGLQISNENIGWQWAGQGKLTFSWNHDQTIKLNAESVLFYLILNDEQTGIANPKIDVNSSFTSAQAVNENELELDVEWQLNQSQSNELFFGALTPNPFNEETKLQIQLPTSETVVVQIFNLEGKLISSGSQYFSAGKHFISVKRAILNGDGVYTLRVEIGNKSQTYKMILLSNN